MENTKKIILDEMPEENLWGNENVRQKYIKEMGFAFVSWQWINPLVEWLNGRKVLEVLAGKGAISYALIEKGVDVIATDNFSWKNHIPTWDETWTEVQDMDAIEAIEKYGKDREVVVMSWAPYQESIGYEVLKKYHEVNPGGILIGIDEGRGGCIADYDFFGAAKKIEDDSFEKVISSYESWYGIHDSPKLYCYKKESDIRGTYTRTLKSVIPFVEDELEKINPDIELEGDIQYSYFGWKDGRCKISFLHEELGNMDIIIHFDYENRKMIFSCEKKSSRDVIVIEEDIEDKIDSLEKTYKNIFKTLISNYA